MINKYFPMITKTYTMEEANVEKLQKIKKEKGISIAWLVNRAVEEYIDKEDLLN